MRIHDLVKHWESNSKGVRTKREFSLRLPLKEAAQVLALKEMYPDCTEDQILTDLICVALEELKQAFPYQKGEQTAVDEFGDPIFEDAGLTPRFVQLARKYRQSLETELGVVTN